ncbi:MAG: hypothetical protein IT449_18595 [Phycisphaerales bacterium]|nr:hypothetical protein [Phycisphaerales bacterium]
MSNQRSTPARPESQHPSIAPTPRFFIPRFAAGGLRLPMLLLVGMGALPETARSQGCFEWSGASWPAPRYQHCMAYDSARGRVVMFGGRYQYQYRMHETWEWDGETWQLRANSGPGEMDSRQWYMAYDSLRSVSVLIGASDNYDTETWEWDGEVWSLRATGGPSRREGAAVAYDAARGVTVLFGGSHIDEGDFGDTWTWDGAQWMKVEVQGPSARSVHAMCYDPRRNVTILFGGVGGTGRLGDTWEWDGSTWKLATGSGPGPRSHHSLAFDTARGMCVLFGGYPRDGSTWEYDGEAWTQRLPSRSPSLRVEASMAFDAARGETVLFGGNEENGHNPNDETWLWNGTDWSQRRREAVIPPARADHAMAYDSARGVTVMFGGGADCGGTCNLANYPVYLGDTWEWDGQTWLLRNDGTDGPSPRAGHAMTYDSARGVVVLFGGSGANYSFKGDTWEWDGATWTLRANSGPPACIRPGMAFDSRRNVVVMFGGRTSIGDYYSGQTWEWDGAAWVDREGRNPMFRFRHMMTYDSLRCVTVCYGGTNSYSGRDFYMSDTVEWDGNVWTTRLDESAPGRRTSGGFAYDAISGLAVIFGGIINNIPVDDVWAWDGSTWFEQNTEGPSARFRHAMVFDHSRERFVAFGGFTGSGGLTYDDTWEGFEDCNCNHRSDTEDVLSDPDCNENGKIDACEVAFGVAADCNGNQLIDECELEDGTAPDCNGNLHIDECDLAEGSSPDCNGNAVPDECDLADGRSQDCNLNLAPDECDIADGTSTDCDSNAVPDDCQPMVDCNHNGIFDACDVLYFDCNRNGVPDDCDLDSGTSQDCNHNLLPDECDIESGREPDHNNNGVPDRCEPCEFVESGAATCQQQNNRRWIVRARIDFDLPLGTDVELCLDQLDCKLKYLGAFGIVRAKWKRLATGDHEVCLGNCPELNLCWQTTCP